MPLLSGKTARKEQNRRAYMRAHGRKTGLSTPTEQTTPLDVYSQANFTLPDSSLFHQALRSADELDESEFIIWDALPPYSQTPPPDTQRERAYTENLGDVMHGRRLRLQRDDQARRWERVASREREAVRAEIIGKIAAGQQRWRALTSTLDGFQGCARHLSVAQINLHWEARLICSLEYELRALEGDGPGMGMGFDLICDVLYQ